MLDARLHSRRGNRPDLRFEIEFVPSCIERFACSGRGQDYELETSRGRSRPLAKLVHERRQLEIGKRRVMSSQETVGSWQGRIEVTAPRSRVLAGAEPFRLRRVQHALDPPAYPAGRLRFRRPDGRQAIEDALRVDLINGQRPDWPTIGREGVTPLLTVLGVRKASLDSVNQGERIVAELRDLCSLLLGLLARLQGIPAVVHLPARVGSQLPRLGQRNPRRRRSQPHLSEAAARTIQEDPLLRAAGPDRQVEPIAVRMSTGGGEGLDGSRREPFGEPLSRHDILRQTVLPQHLPQQMSWLMANYSERLRTV